MKKQSILILVATTAMALCLAIDANAAQKPSKDTTESVQTTSSPATKNAETKAAKGKLSAKDKAFMMKAAKGGMMEVEMGKVAAQNAQNADVKKFGNRMVTEHSKANNELMALAKEEGVQLPASKPAHKWKSDKAYMDDMVKDHEKDLAEFQNEAQNGTDADLKKFANKGSKMVSKHLQMAKEIQGKLK